MLPILTSTSRDGEKPNLKDEPELLDRWDKDYGDRMTELVFIGLGMKPDKLESSLDGCLLTDKEMISDWSRLADRLPAFHTNMMEEIICE
ncbi:GTP-binding protein [Cytobacillus firmus]|uniref:GTP-binding protein n=1 Tax=Cytobacillus firmus TaxID=1399 RepID=UPI0030016F2C